MITSLNEWKNRLIKENNDIIKYPGTDLFKDYENKIKWTFDEYGTKQMEYDENTPHTLYSNNKNESIICIYCLDGQWYAHLEDPYNEYDKVIEIDSFELGCEYLKWFLQTDTIQYCIENKTLNESKLTKKYIDEELLLILLEVIGDETINSKILYLSNDEIKKIKEKYIDKLPSFFASPEKSMSIMNIFGDIVNDELYFDDSDLVLGDKTIIPSLLTKNLKTYNDVFKFLKSKKLNESKAKSFMKMKFNSHTWHNPECDILEGQLDNDTFITYGVYVKDGTYGTMKQGDEFMEYYSGENYVLGSKKRPHSKVYNSKEIPAKYKELWNELKSKYEEKYKGKEHIKESVDTNYFDFEDWDDTDISGPAMDSLINVLIDETIDLVNKEISDRMPNGNTDEKLALSARKEIARLWKVRIEDNFIPGNKFNESKKIIKNYENINFIITKSISIKNINILKFDDFIADIEFTLSNGAIGIFTYETSNNIKNNTNVCYLEIDNKVSISDKEWLNNLEKYNDVVLALCHLIKKYYSKII